MENGFKMSGSVVYLLLTILTAIGKADDAKLTAAQLSGSDLTTKLEAVEFVLVLFCEDSKAGACTSVQNDLEGIEGTSLETLELVVTSSPQDAVKYGVSKSPTLLFFRQNTPIVYNAPSIDADDVTDWLEINRDVSTLTLTDETFEHDTQAATGATTGDWLVMFYKPECAAFLPYWELVAAKSKHERPVARVDLATSPGLEKRFQITKCPVFSLFSKGKVYHYSGPPDMESILTFSRTSFKTQEGLPVPSELSAFDGVFSNIAAVLGGKAPIWIAVAVVVSLLLAVVGLVIGKSAGKKSTQSKEKKTD